MDDSCPFCLRIAANDVTSRQGGAVAFPDTFPLARGHTLVGSVIHEPDLFSLPPDVVSDMWDLALVRGRELREAGAEGVNIGANVGNAAGQTIPHAHLHVIPRRTGDVPDPRGGVRWVLPSRAAYWSE